MTRFCYLALLSLLCATPAIAQTPLEIVVLHRGEDSGPLAPSKIVAILKAIAADLNVVHPRTGPWGVLRKTSGHQCLGYSCDVICTQGGRQFDVFRDSEGAAEPTWGEIATPNPQQGCEIVGGSAPPPPVEDLRLVVRELQAQVAALTRVLEALKAQDGQFIALFQDLAAANAANTKAIGDLKAYVDAVAARPLPAFPCSTGRVAGLVNVRVCPEEKR